MDRLRRIITLFHHRWSLPLVAELSRAEGARFVALVNRLEASPTAVRQALDHLIAHGLVTPNPGYGHPLRPDYILTPSGEEIARPCERLDSLVVKLGVRDVALRKWSMPVLYAIGEGASRFSEIPRMLGDATDRAVSLSLKELEAATMVGREILELRPPVSLYRATGVGKKLVPVLAEL